jgi:hypothetical protein
VAVVTGPSSALELVRLYAEIGRELTSPRSRTGALSAVCHVAVDRVPGAEWASVTEGRRGRFATVAATDDAARAVDAIQYELGSGPCVDAILGDVVFRTGDLLHDERWPEFAKRAQEEHGVRSMLAYRLYLEDDDRIAGLNLFSTRKNAFDDTAEVVGTLIATHGALAIALASANERAAQLQQALLNSREIAMAVGVLVATLTVSREQAFDLLRIASQNSNRRLIHIAAEVNETGVLPLPGAVAT